MAFRGAVTAVCLFLLASAGYAQPLNAQAAKEGCKSKPAPIGEHLYKCTTADGTAIFFSAYEVAEETKSADGGAASKQAAETPAADTPVADAARTATAVAQSSWKEFRTMFCKVSFACTDGEPSWLGWMVLALTCLLVLRMTIGLFRSPAPRR